MVLSSFWFDTIVGVVIVLSIVIVFIISTIINHVFDKYEALYHWKESYPNTVDMLPRIGIYCIYFLLIVTIGLILCVASLYPDIYIVNDKEGVQYYVCLGNYKGNKLKRGCVYVDNQTESYVVLENLNPSGHFSYEEIKKYKMQKNALKGEYEKMQVIKPYTQKELKKKPAKTGNYWNSNKDFASGSPLLRILTDKDGYECDVFGHRRNNVPYSESIDYKNDVKNGCFD